MKKSATISAQIILKSKSGKKMATTRSITSKNVASLQPSKATMDRAVKILKKAGFTVNASGTTLSIHSELEVFQKYFNTTVANKSGSKNEFIFKSSEPIIPAELKAYIEQIVLPQSPELF